MCDCWDEDELVCNRTQIVELCSRIAQLHKTASSYLYAAGSLISQLQATADDATDHAKVLRVAAGLAERELPRTDSVGSERVRFVSGITNAGLVTFEDTIAAVAPRVIVIDDSWGAASSMLLAELRRLAMERGHNIVTCACPLFPFTKIDHLLLPDLGLAFATRNKLHPITLVPERTIHARRFTDLAKLRSKKHRMSFLLRAALGMLEQASLLIAEAKASHDQLERYYVEAMDFDKVEAKLKELTARFRTLAGR